MAPIAAVLCSGLAFVAGASRTEDLFMNDCQNYLIGETSSPKESLAMLCDRHGFSAEACDAALATLPGRLTRKGIKPFCAALESSRGADKVIARLQHRRGHKGESRTVRMVNLDKAVASKKGQPDYLVASDDPPVFEEPPAPLSHPPPSPVDMTIAQPPDANGNPYDEPQWGVNGPPGAVPAPAPPPPAPPPSAPAVPEAALPPASAVPEAAPAEPAPAETPAESEATPEEGAPAESEEAPSAEEAIPEDSDAAPAEAEAEAVEEEASEEAPVEVEQETEPEAEEEAEAAETEVEQEAEPETEEEEQ